MLIRNKVPSEDNLIYIPHLAQLKKKSVERKREELKEGWEEARDEGRT